MGMPPLTVANDSPKPHNKSTVTSKLARSSFGLEGTFPTGKIHSQRELLQVPSRGLHSLIYPLRIRPVPQTRRSLSASFSSYNSGDCVRPFASL